MQITSYSEYTHVVIGIIQNTKHQVLVSKRAKDAHQGGLWEFPGGKVEPDETAQQALIRELHEEVAINCISCVPLIQIPYVYEDRKVFLDVFRITDYSGIVTANESQELNWLDIYSCDAQKFPSANHGIIKALQLPTSICVTPNFSENTEEFLLRFEKKAGNQSTSIIQLRSHELSNSEYIELAKKCRSLCKQSKLVLNCDVKIVQEFNADGLHLTSKRLMRLSERPQTVKSINEKNMSSDVLISASCHTAEEISHASSLGLDYIFLGPVIEKNIGNNAHKKAPSLGWERFHQRAKESVIPVYAIGGLKNNDIELAIQHGAQGIAAIRDFWSS